MIEVVPVLWLGIASQVRRPSKTPSTNEPEVAGDLRISLTKFRSSSKVPLALRAEATTGAARGLATAAMAGAIAIVPLVNSPADFEWLLERMLADGKEQL